jgi:2-C-methyl-D-erythritol 4-phosphate cytidylyltransferase
MNTFALLLPAAGSGSRFNAARGGEGGKTGVGEHGRSAAPPADTLLHDLRGQTVLQRAIAPFAARADVALILIVTSSDRFDGYRRHLHPTLGPHASKLHFAAGGRERWESVLFGLRYLATLTAPPPFVAVHDAARPLTPPSLIEEAFRVAVARGGALPALAEPATLKRCAPDGTVAETVSRANLFQAQTPQCFDFAKLLAAYEALLRKNRLADVTDDAQVFERAGHPVVLTPGSALNLKITTPEDLLLARALVSD